MIRKLFRRFILKHADRLDPKIACALHGHAAGLWFFRHSMGPYRYDGETQDRVHLRVGCCDRCRELVCEEYKLPPPLPKTEAQRVVLT